MGLAAFINIGFNLLYPGFSIGLIDECFATHSLAFDLNPCLPLAASVAKY